MKTRTTVTALLLLGATPAHAHRLDEYLQATMISVAKDRVHVQMHLTPGVAVFASMLAAIDTNADGVLSPAEHRAYAERVLGDLSLAIDGNNLALRLVSSKFASIAEMKEGRGDIEIDFAAVVPGGGLDRRLTFANHHLSRISVYLVNALVPRDANIRIMAQSRSYEQSSYQLDYAQGGAIARPQSLASGARSGWAWLIDVAGGFLVLLSVTGLGLLWYLRKVRLSGL